MLLCIFYIFSFSSGKEIFSEQKIKNFLTEDNPYIYTILGKKYIYQGKLKYYQGFFDTNIKGKYEKKDYPVSTGKFYSLFLEKPLMSGLELNFGYRKAEGIQEYNNIKTGKDGEVLIGIKVPVFKITRNINERRLNLFLTKLDISEIDFEYRNKLRKLYFKIISSYYKLLYYKKLVEIENQLLKKAEKRKDFILKKIEQGLFPNVVSIEAEQQIINRKQRLLKAKNNYEVHLLSFLKYLGIGKEEFEEMYVLPDFPDVKLSEINLKDSLSIAFRNRPDLKKLKVVQEKLKKETNYYSLLKYPELNISLYGVHDFNYDSGFKISIDAKYPLERRKYLGKKIEINKSLLLLDKKKEKIEIEIKTNLQNIVGTLKTIRQNIKNSEEEIKLVKKLEQIELKKFKLGSSDLFYVNQREIYTLETIKKNLKYKLDYLILYKKYLMELGIPII